MKITDIESQKRNENRVNIYLDNKFYCGLNKMTLFQNRIKVGMDVDEEFLNEIILASEREEALTKTVNLLAKSPKTENQVVEYLRNKGYPQVIIDDLLKKLKEYNLINDEIYASTYVGFNKQTKGAYRIKFELKQKGISDEIIAKLDLSDDFENAVAIAKKFLKLKKNEKNFDDKFYRHMAAKGYSYDTINAAKERMKEDEDN